MSDVRRIGPIGLVNEDAVFIKLLDGSDLKLTSIAGPYAVAVYDAIATALRTTRNEALEEAFEDLCECSSRDHIRLISGELTEREMLTAQSIMAFCRNKIRTLKHKDGQP